jgi:Holliday junction DNA helicase RuvB
MQEELYGVMEDFAYDEYDSYFDKNIRVSLPKFTLIGATTHAGNLNTPLLSRFQDRIELSPYSQVQLVDMIAKAAQRMYSVELPNDIAIMMAKLSRKTARHAYSLLNSYMEVVEAMTPGSVRSSDLTSDILLKALRLKRLDPVLGLDVASRKYLVTMLRERSPLGAKSLATMINEQEATITNMIEPFLFSDIEFAIGDETFYGAMARPSRKGRMATEIAEAYIKACQDMQRQEGWFSNESLSF